MPRHGGAERATPRVRVLDAPVDPVTAAAARRRVLSLARRPRTSRTALVVTANPELLVAARRDLVLHRVLEEAALVLADGSGLLLAARMLGTSLPTRVPGIELLEALLGDAERLQLRPYLLGARPDVIDAAVRRLRGRFPTLRLAGWEPGYFPLEDPRPVRAVARSGADMLFVGMGGGRALRWLYANRERLRVPVAMGVGGSFDVLAGRVPRAPAWMRRSHLEWLYRLLREPRRWRRQLALPGFALAVTAEAIRRRGQA